MCEQELDKGCMMQCIKECLAETAYILLLAELWLKLESCQLVKLIRGEHNCCCSIRGERGMYVVHGAFDTHNRSLIR